jgi:4-amino-4-deoxy-L-arabinose transferase-like glycosyltransferase
LAFAAIVFVCTRFGWQIAGPAAGIASGVAVMLLPRLFAHAHLASPEVISSAFFLLGLASASWAMEGVRTRPDAPLTVHTWRWLAAGIVLGAALLTKLTVVLLPVAVAVYAVLRLRWRSILPLSIWGGAGLVVFIAGWPWLWPFDFPGHPPGWFGTVHRLVDFGRLGVDRAIVYVDYFGTQYPNARGGVPWHFVWIFFLVTVPAGLQVTGVLFGLPLCWQRSREKPAAGLLLTAVGVVLGFFTLPIDRYDGERLFLMVFPLWAVVIGVVTVFMIAQGYGLVHYHPYQLSYYNLLVGGLAGADALGLEATYWGDTVSEEMLDRFAAMAEQQECAILLPTLYAGHTTYLHLSSAGMLEKRQSIVPGDQRAEYECRWAILFNRAGYIAHDELPKRVVEQGRLRAELALDGVWLTRIYELPDE